MSEQVRADRCETCRFWQKCEYAAPEGETDEQRADRLDNMDRMSSCHIRSVPHSLFPNRRASDWCGEHEPAEQRDPYAGFSAVLPHPDAIPQWRKRPTLPGLYVCWPHQAKSPEAAWALYLGKEDLERGAPFQTTMCYGPIEKPNETTSEMPG